MKTKTEYAVVIGSFTFPFDMLRYDQCWPVCEGQIGLLAGGHAERAVVVASYGRFTISRWRSFGWQCTEFGSDQRSATDANRKANEFNAERSTVQV